MIFPIGDDNTGRTTTPYVNYLLIAANVLVFALFQGLGSNDRFTYAWATVPAYVALGLWFLFQFVSGLGILGRSAPAPPALGRPVRTFLRTRRTRGILWQATRKLSRRSTT